MIRFQITKRRIFAFLGGLLLLAFAGLVVFSWGESTARREIYSRELVENLPPPRPPPSMDLEPAGPQPTCYNGQGGWAMDREYIVTPATLTWESSAPPPDLQAALLHAYELDKPEYANMREDGQPEHFDYAYVDLIGDDSPEVIADYETFSGSGGRSFMFLRRHHGKWQPILGFLGAFYAPKTNHKFEEIVAWFRDGDHYERSVATYSAKRGVYRFGKFEEIPQELSDLPTGWVDLWRFFWTLAGKKENCLEAFTSGGSKKQTPEPKGANET